jgi:hypothetical protein
MATGRQRSFGALAAAALVAIIAGLSVVDEASTAGVGDANCDSIADTVDAALVLIAEAGLAQVDCPDRADANSDGRVDSKDAAVILQIAAGLHAKGKALTTPTPIASTVLITPTRTPIAPTATPCDPCPTPTSTPTRTQTPTPCPPQSCTPTPTNTAGPPTVPPTGGCVVDPDCPPPTPDPFDEPTEDVAFSISVDADGNGIDDCTTGTSGPATCSLPRGAMFVVQLSLDVLPGPGYYRGVEAVLAFDGVASKADPSNAAWPDCVFQATFVGPSSWLAFGCVVGVEPAPSSQHLGVIGTATFHCTESGSVSLLHGSGNTNVVPEPWDNHVEALDGQETLTINCG